ncbi:DNA excision repair protein ERCC-3 [Paenibacillus cellulosilyticus]|uniref:DNA 3'-5' helicase n=1 Tax=Paenibacillus cellulosilyticus TaxID=375489 RepID=A0A2V2YWS2_9BACL|nr:DNA repair helicase XPB [Paenibacillus cellulosilyticus]PWW06197.1 DNA excision repair protein ERCC-3 [Paenibacillus cellulosilyticus]QKS43041.1 helicase-associated domain-containing protein [Paenibacillus cellulosilyticus]
MMESKGKPIIVLSDLTILYDERTANDDSIRERLSVFAELMKQAGPLHTYRMTHLALWNAASLGMQADEVIEMLNDHARYAIAEQVIRSIRQIMGRYGRLMLERMNGEEQLLQLRGDEAIINDIAGEASLNSMFSTRVDAATISLRTDRRGLLKQELLRLGYPVIDTAGYRSGETLSVTLRDATRLGVPFKLREYQSQAVDRFFEDSRAGGGSGVIVLPCGAGKTIVGIGVLSRLQCATLILTSSLTSVNQWKSEILDKTTIDSESIGEYSSKQKQVRPITIATYNMMATSAASSESNAVGAEEQDYRHLQLFGERDWGLIIYDEVHMLPAPVFRMTADLQATRRLGLTATLVREDGRERDVFSLIGPKRYELPWKQLEQSGDIAAIHCEEVRVPLHDASAYWVGNARARARLAAENPNKTAVVRQLLSRHKGRPALVIGVYLRQLEKLANELGAPLLTGEVAQEERARLYEAFRRGEHPVLVVSKVANFAVDLPDASVAVQVSGSYGSRQEEAQRIGRLLRPKRDHSEAVFYSLVTEGTTEVDYALKRQRFMIEQGYRYSLTAAAVQMKEEKGHDAE